MTAITRPAFVNGISRRALRADNPDALAADLRGDGYRDETGAYARHLHLLDPAPGVHALIYESGVITFFAPSWDVLRPVLTGLADRGLAR